jgi:hypothetical protein
VEGGHGEEAARHPAKGAAASAHAVGAASPAGEAARPEVAGAVASQFQVLKRFTLTDTDGPTHGVRQRRIYRFLRYRHRHRGLTDHPLTRLHLLRPIKLEEH